MSELERVSFRKGVGEHQPRLSEPYVPGKHDKRFWTAAEDAVLRAHYPKGSYAACLPHLGPHRSNLSVYQRAHKLGLDAPRERGGGQKTKIVPPADIDDQLRALYQNGDGKKRGECDAFADGLKLPRWWVTKRATNLGLVMPHKKEPPWTAAENALMAQVPLHDVERCAKIFREHGFARSPTAIMVRAKRLNLSRRYKEAMTARAVGRILGVDIKTVTREILQGDLTAEKRPTNRLSQQGGDPWAVTPANLREYILKHLDRVDLRKVDKFAFVQIVAGEPLEPTAKGQA